MSVPAYLLKSHLDRIGGQAYICVHRAHLAFTLTKFSQDSVGHTCQTGGGGGEICFYQETENPWLDGSGCELCGDGEDNDCDDLTDGEEAGRWAWDVFLVRQ